LTTPAVPAIPGTAGFLDNPVTSTDPSAHPWSCSSNPKSRPAPSDFIASCRQKGGFFDNSFVDSMLFLEEMAVQDAEAKAAFFKGLPDVRCASAVCDRRSIH